MQKQREEHTMKERTNCTNPKGKNKWSSSIKFKTNLILISVLAVSFSIMTFTVYKSIHNRITEDINENMISHLSDLKTILDNHVKSRQKMVNMAITIANNALSKHGEIIETNSNIEVVGINQKSKTKSVYNIPQWEIEGTSLYQNTTIVDEIKSLSVESATIFQKVEDGYLRISTNVKKADGKRATNTYIPNSSEVIKTIEKGNTYFGRAFVVDSWYLTAYKPLYINNEIKGILYVGVKEIDYAEIKQVFASKKYFKNGYPFLIDKNGNFIIHPSKEGENFAQAHFFKQLINSKEGDYKNSYLWPETGDSKEKIQFFTYFSPYEAYISTSIYKEDAFGGLRKLINIVLGIILVSAFLIYLILNGYLSPIINQLKKLANATNIISSGDLTIEVTSNRKDELGQLSDGLRSMTHKLKEIIEQITMSSHQINTSGVELDSTSQNLSLSASEQASSIEEVSSVIEEISTGITNNSENAIATNKISNQVASEIKDVNQKAQLAVDLNNEIAEKIKIIDSIAAQTNILSLNAAIEASKAGMHGRGFNVVAEEVRKLAEISKSSAQEIIQLVTKSVAMTTAAKDSLQELIPSVLKSSQLVKEITSAGKELESGINEINHSIQVINNTTAENAAGSEELAASAKELSNQSKGLLKLVSYFKINKSTTSRKEVSTSDILKSKEPTNLYIEEKIDMNVKSELIKEIERL